MYQTFSKNGTLFKGEHYLRKYGIRLLSSMQSIISRVFISSICEKQTNLAYKPSKQIWNNTNTDQQYFTRLGKVVST